MSLREYQQQQEQQKQQNQGLGGPFQAPRGTTWFEPYRQPLQGEVNGEPVLVLQIGDQPGSSDVFKCIGRDGTMATVRERDLRITSIVSPAGAYLPVDTALGMGSTRRFNANQLQQT